MTERTVEIRSVEPSWDDDNEQLLEIDFKLASNQDDDEFPSIEGRLTYHARQERVTPWGMYTRMNKAFKEIADALYEWAESAQMQYRPPQPTRPGRKPASIEGDE